MSRVILFTLLFIVSACNKPYAEYEIIHHIDFENGTVGHEKEEEIVRAFYKKELEDIYSLYDLEPSELYPEGEPVTPVTLAVDTFDLNDDGIEEIFVYFEHSFFCGTAGCTSTALGYNGDEWEEIASMHSYRPIRVVLQDITRGYHDIALNNDIGLRHLNLGLHIWKWDGQRYRHSHFAPHPDVEDIERNPFLYHLQ